MGEGLVGRIRVGRSLDSKKDCEGDESNEVHDEQNLCETGCETTAATTTVTDCNVPIDWRVNLLFYFKWHLKK